MHQKSSQTFMHILTIVWLTVKTDCIKMILSQAITKHSPLLTYIQSAQLYTGTVAMKLSPVNVLIATANINDHLLNYDPIFTDPIFIGSIFKAWNKSLLVKNIMTFNGIYCFNLTFPKFYITCQNFSKLPNIDQFIFFLARADESISKAC